jgi:DNA-directed RNA polymerase, mitochondrial
MSKILMIDNTVALPPDRVRTNVRYGVEINGDSSEVEITLDACLQVQRWDRAFALLKQLVHIHRPGSPDLLPAYNRCLEAMVVDMLINKSRTNVDRINQWVEVDMADAGIKPDARTYALKIKVALATLVGSKRDRTVRRYWEKAKEQDAQFEVAGLRDVLTDSDLGKLNEICPINIDFELNPEDLLDVDVEVNATENIAQAGVLETAQKGLGLSSLKKSLSLFSGNLHLGREDFQGTPEEIERQYAEARQSRLETDAIDSAIERWRVEHEKMTKMGIISNLQHGKLGALLWQWHEMFTQKLKKEMKLVEEAESKAKKNAKDRLRCEYGPFLRLMSPEHIAATTTIAAVQIMNKMGMKDPIKTAVLVIDLGKAIEAESEAVQIRAAVAATRKHKRLMSRIAAHARAVAPGVTQKAPDNPPHTEQPMSIVAPRSILYKEKRHWSTAIHTRVGAILCELLLDSCKITVSKEDQSTKKMLHIAQPVFTRQFVYVNGRKVGTVSLHSDIVDMLAVEPASNVIAKQLPMVCKPKPWKGLYEGGFLQSQGSFLRVKNNEVAQRDYGEAAAQRGDLDQVFAGVDVLGRTAWRINRDVFNVMLEAWNSGQEIANLPPAEKVFPKIEKPTNPKDREARLKWYYAVREIENEKSGLHSNRCFQNFQMEIAKSYLNEVFYLPHNIDFRGRAYPIPPYLNQMGADNCRGLLLFDKGRQLGPQGLRWLKIHLANVYGYDKASLSDRENFPMTHYDDVVDSVNNPLGGRRWWLTAEDPWQCLATCIELKKALDLPDPTQFVSHLPIHQDGSCNGLQHYAALGGDIAGAKQVNLEPGDRPADVYTGVAELVKAEIKEDAAQGDELAQALVGKVSRKIVKQTVMTNVYGVTFLGAIRQVRKQVDDLLPEFKNANPPRSGAAATYIARKIFKALGAMFSGAHDIQYWLGDCANRISSSLSPAQLQQIADSEAKTGTPSKVKAGSASIAPRKSKRKADGITLASTFRSSVIWTTPLKLPVVQPYRTSKGQRIKTNMQDITIVEPTIADSVNKRKQLQAFPPNFIHSLDATHMILSALQCDERGLTFSAVHDSFWTHAADVDTLNTVLRDAFIRMHSEDIIGRLAAEFKTRYKDHLYLATIRKSTVLAQKLKEYRSTMEYTRGSSPDARRYEELLREIKKQKLMSSDDPAEREKGEEMVTAASLYQKYNGDKYLYTKDSLGETAIGVVPTETSEKTIEKALRSDEAIVNVDMGQTLDPLIHAPSTTEVDDPDVGADAADLSEVKRATNSGKASKPGSKKSHQYNFMWLWLPLTFRDVPKKVCYISSSTDRKSP